MFTHSLSAIFAFEKLNQFLVFSFSLIYSLC